MGQYEAAADNLYRDPRTGIYFVQVQVRGRRRKRTTHETSFSKARERAARLVTELRDEATGWRAGESPTWDQWWASCEDSYLETELASEHSRALYRWAVAHRETERMFGRRRLSDITPQDCKRLVVRLGKTLAPGSVRSAMSALSSILGWAVAAKELAVNPWAGIERPVGGRRERVLTLAEQDALLAAVETPWFGRYIQVLLCSGLRASEALGLTEASVLWDAELIDLVGKGGKRRQVPLLPPLVPHLEAQLAAAKGGRLFPYHLHTVQQQFARLGQRAGVTGITAHVLRHTFATRWVEGGGDIYALSKILGHASVEITERIYVHEAPASRVALAKQLVVALGVAPAAAPKAAAPGQVVDFKAFTSRRA
jgi:integrase